MDDVVFAAKLITGLNTIFSRDADREEPNSSHW
jgi:hypothetical protein